MEVTRRQLFRIGQDGLPPRSPHPATPALAVAGPACLSLAGTACRVCGEWCEAGAIGFRLMTGGRAEVRVDAGRCDGCGDCVPRCPVRAIRMADRAEETAECA